MKDNIALMIILFPILSISIFSQDCNCLEDFEYLVAKTEANYIGYYIKVTPQSKPDYEKFTSTHRQKAKVSSNEECIFILREWLDYFKDYHLFIVENPKFTEAEKQQFLVNAPSLSISESEIKTYLQKNSKKLDSIEGLWFSKSEKYAIIADPKIKKRFIAVVLETQTQNWKSGQIRTEFWQKSDGTYKTVYFMDDHSKRNVISAIYKDILFNVGIYGWGKTFPLSKNAENFLDSSDPQKPTLKIIDGKNILISIPTFDDPSYRQVLENLLKENHERILASENLLIDLRGNSGGSRFDDLLAPYIFTGEFKVNEPNFALASKDNLQYFKYLSRVSVGLGKRLAPVLERMETNPNKIVPYFDESFDKPDIIYPTPKNVAILIDRAVGSASEGFLLDAIQSKRVKLFGENTKGNIDYQQTTAIPLKCEKRGLILGYPMYTRTRNLPKGAIDYIGIPPNVRISEKVRNQVQFVVDYYTRRK